MNQDYMEQLRMLRSLSEQAEQAADALLKKLNTDPSVSEDYRRIFAPSDIARELEGSAADWKKRRTALLAGLEEYARVSDSLSSYEHLLQIKSVADSAVLPLCVLLKKLGAEAEKTKALTNRLMGDYASEDAEKLLREYTEQRRKLREKARDKAAFDKAFMLRSEQPKAKRSQTSAPKSTSPQSQNTARTVSPFAGIKTGSIVQFGHYHQNADGKDSTPIDWRVLAVSGGKALLISEKGLDCQKYNESWTDVTWETCSLRKWMNSTFLNAAFQPEERNRIQNTTCSADKNPNYNTNPGNATTDKVFLLSITEVNKYFTSDEARKCVPTEYAIKRGAYTSGSFTVGGKATCWWWLRSPGCSQNTAAYVRHGGSVGCRGDNVNSGTDCVRPALWINLDS